VAATVVVVVAVVVEGAAVMADLGEVDLQVQETKISLVEIVPI